MGNLTYVGNSGKAHGSENVSQVSEKPQVPQGRNPVDLCATWHNLQRALQHGWIPYAEVKAWCDGLTDLEEEGLLRELQEQAMREDWSAAA